MEKCYMIVDLGTGNSRVVLMKPDGKIIDMSSFENKYYRDDLYEDAQYFLPLEWKDKIFEAVKTVTERNKDVEVVAISSSGARQTIVCFDEKGEEFIGLPNIDNRARKWMDDISNKEYIYEKSGHWVTEDFPVAKLMGYRKKHRVEFYKIRKITSLSEWIGKLFTNKIVIEPSQACETQLYDMDSKEWSKFICEEYKIDYDILPPLMSAGESLGVIEKEISTQLGISDKAEFIIGGADTQLAAKAVGVQVGDICIVSGTTSPVITIVKDKFYDKKERCWTGLNLGGDSYQIETNPGVTGNNFQRFKRVMFPNTSYEELDKMILEKTDFRFTATFSSLHFSKRRSLKKGGFVSHAPFAADIDLVDFAYAMIADIACAIYVQYQSLKEMIANENDYICACGGGFQSKALCQMIADLTDKKLVLVEGFEQSSALGCTWICNEYFGLSNGENLDKKIIYTPTDEEVPLIEKYYQAWVANRRLLNPIVE